MATARGMFDAAKHPRGSHGRFGSAGRMVVKGVHRLPRKEVHVTRTGRWVRISSASELAKQRYPSPRKKPLLPGFIYSR